MGEDYIPLENGTKKQKYAHLIQQLEYRLDPSNHPQSNRCNTVALLKQQFNWWWIGYYFISNPQHPRLVLGPFQGPAACTNIFKGQGVCGTSWQKDKTIVVPNVNEFEGHIACSSKSQSEIVIPIRRNGIYIGLLDIDSVKLNDFDQADVEGLEKIIGMLEGKKMFEDWK